MDDDKLIFGLDDSAILTKNDPQIHHQCKRAWDELKKEAQKQGIELAAASSYRSFEHQKKIWNAKLSGQRTLRDRHNKVLNIKELSLAEILEALMHWSAAPGLSRHHWGTEVDVIDQKALNEQAGYQVELIPSEYRPGAIFEKLASFLNDKKKLHALGFYRPYDEDLGGVAKEPWHISYYPLATKFEKSISPQKLLEFFEGPQCQDVAQIEYLKENYQKVYEHYFVCRSEAPIA